MSDEPAWRPSVADVARLLVARTHSDVAGEEIGTFDPSTRPTSAQVEGLIDHAANEVQDTVRWDIADSYADDATRLAALRAAALVEASYFPDEIDTGSSPHRQYQAMYLDGIRNLTTRLQPFGLQIGVAWDQPTTDIAP